MAAAPRHYPPARRRRARVSAVASSSLMMRISVEFAQDLEISSAEPAAGIGHRRSRSPQRRRSRDLTPLNPRPDAFCKMRVAVLSLLAVAAAHAASPVALGHSRVPTLRTAAAMPASNLGAQSLRRASAAWPPRPGAGNVGAPACTPGVRVLTCAKASRRVSVHVIDV